jgi:uncharacterized protein (TIGR03437 family)
MLTNAQVAINCTKPIWANNGTLLKWNFVFNGCTIHYQLIRTSSGTVNGKTFTGWNLWVYAPNCGVAPRKLSPEPLTNVGARAIVDQTCGASLGNLFSAGPPASVGESVRRAVSGKASATPAPSGQAAQGTVFADLNGDGIADAIYIGSGGLVVELLGSDGSVENTFQDTLPFTPDPALSLIVAADFNGDGKMDVAVSNPGNPGTDNGSVAVLLGKGDGTFQPAKTFPAGQNPSALAAADFNGDGNIDLAAGSSVAGTIAVLAGDGQGNMGTAVSYGNGGDAQAIPVSILAIDLNGDGRPDLAVANQGFVTVPNSSISMLLNTGSGFQPKFNAPLALSLIPNFLAYADLNNDGNTDLVAASPAASAVIVMFGKGDGTFQTQGAYAAGNSAGAVALLPLEDTSTMLASLDEISGGMWLIDVSPEGSVPAPPLHIVGGAPTGIALGDLNGDGEQDAVVTGGSSDVSVLLAAKNVFQPPAGYSLAQPSPMPRAVAIGDMNNDGKPDVVVASTGQPGNPGLVSVLLDNNDGSLQAPRNTNVNQFAQSIALADLNHDKNLDVVVAAYGSQVPGGTDAGAVDVLLGNGDGTFQALQTLMVTGLHPEAVAVGDVNGDGVPDIAAVMVSSYLSGTCTLAIFLGKGDGTFQSARTFPLQSVAGSLSGIVIGDWNGDGKPDIAAVSQSNSASNVNLAVIDVLLGNGAGNFTEASKLAQTEADPVYLATADVNGDGNADLIVAHCCGESDATYLLGNGDGTFQSEQQLPLGNSPMAVSLITAASYTTVVAADNGSAAVTAVSLIPWGNINANVSAANSAMTTLAPSSIASMYGTGLATTTGGATTSTLPTNLEGTTVTIIDSSGAQLSAPLFYVSPKQVNYQIPPKTAIGQAGVIVTNGNGIEGSGEVQIAPVAPGLFETNSAGLAAGYAVIYHANGTQTVEQIYTTNSAGAIAANPISLGSGSDMTYLFLFGTGLRNTGAENVQVTIGGIDSTVSYVGPQGAFLGLDQVNVLLPPALAGKGKVTIQLIAAGIAANLVNVTVL